MKVGPKERNGQSLLSRRHVAGGETGADNRLLQALLERTGVTILGKRMFEEGEHNWPEEAPFHTPVFVLTHEVRKPWERKGGTTFVEAIHSPRVRHLRYSVTRR